MDKIGRNDPCSCGSGKKFKKCCEGKSPLKKINAQVISSGQSSGLSSFFQKKVAIPRKENDEPKNIIM
jgi:hypothetical protein